MSDLHQSPDGASTRQEIHHETHADHVGHGGAAMPKMSWARFAAMIVVSTAVMFPLMYQLVYEPSHATFSLTRLVSCVVMGCVMAAIMLAFMWKMYDGQGTKLAVLIGCIALGIVTLMVNRQQMLIGDVDFMQSMIPHHSIAINNAKKATIRDPRVRKLADGIIEAQVKEIDEMKMLTADIRAHGIKGDGKPIPARSAELTPDLHKQAEAAIAG